MTSLRPEGLSAVIPREDKNRRSEALIFRPESLTHKEAAALKKSLGITNRGATFNDIYNAVAMVWSEHAGDSRYETFNDTVAMLLAAKPQEVDLPMGGE